jgi:hypothetical protein
MNDEERAKVWDDLKTRRLRLLDVEIEELQDEIEGYKEQLADSRAKTHAAKFSPFFGWPATVVAFVAAGFSVAVTCLFAICAGLPTTRYWIAQLVTVGAVFALAFFVASACNREAFKAYLAEYRRCGGKLFDDRPKKDAVG